MTTSWVTFRGRFLRYCCFADPLLFSKLETCANVMHSYILYCYLPKHIDCCRRKIDFFPCIRLTNDSFLSDMKLTHLQFFITKASLIMLD